ncbi:MAG: MFS transporter [Nitriliruptoraceae bacterium]
MKLRPSHTAIAIGGFGTIIGSMPSMLTGALAVDLTAALSFSVAGLGTAVAIQNAFGAIASVPLGSLVDRLGATRSIRLAMLLTAFVAFGIATFTRSYIVLVILITVGGLSKRIMEPASNRLLVTSVGPRRLGLAFGIKQSAPPAAVMLAGLSVPLVAGVWGWRAAFYMSGVMAVLLAAAVRRRPDTAANRAAASAEREASTSPTSSDNVGSGEPVDGDLLADASGGGVDEVAGDATDEVSRDVAESEDVKESARPHADAATSKHPAGPGALIALTIAFAFANGASVTVPVFYVSAAVAAGATQATAGTMLAAASIASILARLTLGVIADRLVDSHLKVCAGMLAAGGIGFGLLATGNEYLVVIGVLVALAGSWGFSGVFWFTLVRAHPDSAGTITGRIAPGALVANSFSPLIFGFVVERFSYAVGWSISGVLAMCAALGMLVGSRMMAKSARSR